MLGEAMVRVAVSSVGDMGSLCRPPGVVPFYSMALSSESDTSTQLNGRVVCHYPVCSGA